MIGAKAICRGSQFGMYSVPSHLVPLSQASFSKQLCPLTRGALYRYDPPPEKFAHLTLALVNHAMALDSGPYAVWCLGLPAGARRELQLLICAYEFVALKSAG